MVQKYHSGVLGINIIRFSGKAHRARKSRYVATFELVGDVGKPFSCDPWAYLRVSPDVNRSIHSDCSAVKGCASGP